MKEWLIALVPVGWEKVSLAESGLLENVGERTPAAAGARFDGTYSTLPLARKRVARWLRMLNADIHVEALTMAHFG